MAAYMSFSGWDWERRLRAVSDMEQTIAQVKNLVDGTAAREVSVRTGLDQEEGTPRLRARLAFANGFGLDVAINHVSAPWGTDGVAMYLYWLDADGTPVEVGSLDQVRAINVAVYDALYMGSSSVDEHELYRVGSVGTLTNLLGVLTMFDKLRAVAA